MRALTLDIAIAAIPFFLNMAGTWRLVWPRWKLFGKVASYFAGVTLLSLWIGHWSLLLAFVHQGLGLAFHIWFCRRHGFTWYAVEDPERYVRLSMEMVGYTDAPPEVAQRDRHLYGVRLPHNVTMQCDVTGPAAAASSRRHFHSRRACSLRGGWPATAPPCPR